MAVQGRRGLWEDFHPEKMLPGEWAFVTGGDPNSENGRSVYACFGPGVVKRMATYEDMQLNIENATDEIRSAFTKDIQDAIARAIAATNSANSASSAANAAASSANAATKSAKDKVAEIERKLQNGDFKGDPGVKGDKGDPGSAATIRVGTVTTGAPGTSAKVTNVGTANAAVLDMTIPRGDTGEVQNINTATVQFTQASARANINTGETFATIFGKLKKWYADLKTVAFSGSYTDLTNKPTIPTAVAVKGNAETSYRTGNVNLTPANIGALAVGNVLNALTATAAGYALDARQGKILKDSQDTIKQEITELNRNMTVARGTISGQPYVSYYRLGNLVCVQGIATINATQVTFTLPYTAKDTTYFSTSALNAQQTPSANFEGVGMVGAGSKSCKLTLSAANTYGAFDFTYYTEDDA